MKSIVISSNSSGGGKTTVTLGLIKALMNRGYEVQGYKVGPDYIDPAFHKFITKKPCRNLDLFLMNEEGVRASFSRGKGDIGIVEGVMGLYDGKGVSTNYSTYHVSKVLNLPIILVISPKGQSATLCAEINGIKNFRTPNIAGIILNNISESYYGILKKAIDINCNVKVFGYIPKDEKLKLKSRHLGLVQSSEIKDLEDKVEYLSKLIEKHINIHEIIKSLKENEKYEDNYHLENKNLRIAVAKDKAFSFYYEENIELLKELGKVIFFSPLKDKKLPEDIDFLYIGGGYPEVFIKKLSQNKSMLKSIKKELDSGLNCYAECGGLMYLTSKIEGCLGVDYFSGNSYMTKKLQNFGYAQMEVTKENNKIPLKSKINCHEFHRSYVELNEKKIYKLTKKMYDGSSKEWECGYIKNNTLATYAHVHFFGNMDILKNIIK